MALLELNSLCVAILEVISLAIKSYIEFHASELIIATYEPAKYYIQKKFWEFTNNPLKDPGQ